MFRRALDYCREEEELNKDLNYILEIGLKHGYRKAFILKVLKETKENLERYKEESMEITGRNEQRFVPIPYHMKDMRVIRNLAKKKKQRLVPRRAPYSI